MKAWTADEVRALGVTTELVTAGATLGLGRSASYELARRGEFPVPVLRIGRRYRVVTQHLLEFLGLATAVDSRPAHLTAVRTRLREAG
jgi:predicted DNA-binding transcriptional regulator AlpA